MLKNGDYIKIISLILLPLSLVKTFNGTTTYFQIFYVILGAYSFLKYKLYLKKPSLLIAAILILNAISSYVISEEVPFLKYAQLCSLIAIVWFIRDRFKVPDFINYSKVLVGLSFGICIFNYWFESNPFASRSILGINRVAGVIGEPNFSAFALTLPWVIFYRNKHYLWLFLTTIPLIWVQSRSIAIFFVTLGILEISRAAPGSYFERLKSALLITFFVSPFIIAAIYNFTNIQQKRLLVEKLSTRFYLTQYYTDLGFHFPLGVGLSRGQKYYSKEGDTFRKDKEIELNTKSIETAEQHSTYSQVFSEFGFLLYLLLCSLLVKLIATKKVYIPYYILPPLSVLIFINGLTELTTFLLVSLIKTENNSLHSKYYD